MSWFRELYERLLDLACSDGAAGEEDPDAQLDSRRCSLARTRSRDFMVLACMLEKDETAGMVSNM